MPRVTKASSLSTQELLSRCFPSGDGPAPDKCTLMDMGAGYGGTARVAAKEFGCKVYARVSFNVYATVFVPTDPVNISMETVAFVQQFRRYVLESMG